MNRVWFCGVPTGGILSSHAACDHLVCVWDLKEYTVNARAVIKQRIVGVTRCQYDRCNPAGAEKGIHVDDSARQRDSGSAFVKLGNLRRYGLLECLQFVVRDDGDLVWRV